MVIRFFLFWLILIFLGACNSKEFLLEDIPETPVIWAFAYESKELEVQYYLSSDRITYDEDVRIFLLREDD